MLNLASRTAIKQIVKKNTIMKHLPKRILNTPKMKGANCKDFLSQINLVKIVVKVNVTTFGILILPKNMNMKKMR